MQDAPPKLWRGEFFEVILMHIMSKAFPVIASLVLVACGGSNTATDVDGSTRLLSYASVSAPVSSAPTYIPISQTSRYTSSSTAITSNLTRARFYGPQGLALCLATGDLYIADTRNYTVRKITRGGKVTTLAGLAGNAGSADGTGSAARFTQPRGIAVDAAGNVYVSDGSVVRRITPAGSVTTMAGLQGQYGTTDGAGAQARFYSPYGIAVDKSNNVYVADQSDSALRIRKITQSGMVSTLAGGNPAFGLPIPHDGSGTNAKFIGPTGRAINGSGTLYVTDVGYGGLTVPNLNDGASFVRRIFSNGAVSTMAGNLGMTGSAPGQTLAQFSYSDGIAVNASNYAFVTDHFNQGNRIKRIAPNGTVTTMSLSPGSFGHLSGLAVDSSGNLFASDSGNHAIYRISPSGAVAVYAGSPGSSGSHDTP
jgi:sugar lactone lactonase YvrE